MAGEQGFVKELNFQEIVRAGQASSIFINLSRIDGITDDIQLFSNNQSNTSELPNTVYSTVVDDDGEINVVIDVNQFQGYFPYSNRTKLVEVDPVTGGERLYTEAEALAIAADFEEYSFEEINGTLVEFFVYDSNADDRFKVRDKYGYNRAVSGNLVRRDVITFESLKNMAQDREQVIVDSISTDDDGNVSSAEDIGFISASVASNYSEINNGLALFRYKESRLPLGYKETFLNKPAAFNGYINISNPDNIDVTNPSLNPPGLYLRPPLGGTPIRAFSDTSNPWDRNDWTRRLETQASKITIQTLVLNTPQLNPTSNDAKVQSEANDLTGTYKIKVEINGVPYFLFAKQG